jgi:hypothetical protein
VSPISLSVINKLKSGFVHKGDPFVIKIPEMEIPEFTFYQVVSSSWQIKSKKKIKWHVLPVFLEQCLCKR